MIQIKFNNWHKLWDRLSVRNSKDKIHRNSLNTKNTTEQLREAFTSLYNITLLEQFKSTKSSKVNENLSMGLQKTHQWLVYKSLTNQTVINRFWIVSTTNTTKILQMTRWIMINLSQMLSSLSFTNNSVLVQINCQINKFSPFSFRLKLLAILHDL